MSDTRNSTSVHDRSREVLYAIIAEETDVAAKRREIVELGAEYLGVSLGFVSAIDPQRETFEVLVSTDDALLAEGATYDLGETYCRKCVESDSSLAVSDAPAAGWANDRAYEEHGLDCYLGTPIYIDDELVGTICFADGVPRETDFSSSERAFVELAARLLGREREIRRYERRLDEREGRLDSRQQDLEASEQKYESLLTTAPDAIFVARDDTGEIVEANEAAAELAGVPAETLIGEPIDEFHPDEGGRRWAEFQHFIAGGEGSMSRYSDGTRLRLERADGTRLPVEVSATRVELDGEEFIQGIVRDISERLERERDIEQQRKRRETTERKYESLVAAAPNAIMLADLANREFVEVNDAAADLTGYGKSELLGSHVKTIHPAGQTERYIEVFDESIGDGGTTKAELPDGSPILVERKDGTTVPVEVSITKTTIDGQPHALAIFRDISGRRERERELRLKNRAIDEASIGITIAEADPDRDFPLVYANEKFREMTGYQWDEIDSRNCRFLQGERTDRETTGEIGSALRADEPIQRELLNYRKNGTPFWNDLRLAPVEDDDGEVTHYVGFQQDVTDRKRKEKLITVLNRVLRHNLRNGMSVIGNRAELLQEELGTDAPSSLGDISSRVEQLTAVSEKAANISKSLARGSGAESKDVVQIVESVAERLGADSEATVHVETPARQSVLATDSLRVALDELATNAVEHGGPAPTVEFTVEVTPNGRVAIHVSDDGPGLPTEERTVLERGYETPLEHGSGLGLWFVTWVVTGVGGRVAVEVEDGTTITLWLQSGETAGDGKQQSALGR